MKKFLALLCALLLPLCFLFGCAGDASTLESSSNGYIDGYSDGYSNGYSDGKESGYTDGYDKGKTDGYTEGKEDGYSEGYEKGKESNKADVSKYYYTYGYDKTFIYYNFDILYYVNPSNGYLAKVTVEFVPTIEFYSQAIYVKFFGYNMSSDNFEVLYKYSSLNSDSEFGLIAYQVYTLHLEVPYNPNFAIISGVELGLDSKSYILND